MNPVDIFIQDSNYLKKEIIITSGLISFFIGTATFFSFFFFFALELFSHHNLNLSYFLRSIRRGFLVACFLSTVMFLKFILKLFFENGYKFDLGIFEIFLLALFFSFVEFIMGMDK